ncbi:unnamed protein product [Bursaphelenchus xylophilus]|uniref:(pine wood nematode) hypothetical protein n=1 Tax=Bursaphelenchus xylophilus TaxID=6326 RepID=A0A1I7SAF2_BURXY|nr:unnamed protein product [Bursaphelenchus xylophilus]CAG9083966.1 unnamed protein product [Bursaphelenchus xylophilus]
MKVNLCLSLVLLIRPLLALEDITDVDMMNFFVAQKFEPTESAGKSHGKNKEEGYRLAPPRKNLGPITTVPPDNFDWAYQKLNQTIFHEAIKEKETGENPYPSLPTLAFNDDPTPFTEANESNGRTVSFRNRLLSLSKSEDISGYLPRTTTQEPQLLASEDLKSTERLHRQIEPFKSNAFDEIDENTPPPPPPPDWAVRMMLSSNQAVPSDNDVTEEPFEVTDALETALSSTFDSLITSTEWSTKQVSEVPTMKMYPWEMQRGDIDIHDLPDGQAPAVPNPTFMPLSIRTPKYNNKQDNVLIPQDLPTDVDLPKIYTIGPRLVLPQMPPRPETPRPPAPSAPPTLIMRPTGQTRPTPPSHRGHENNLSEVPRPRSTLLPTFVTDDDIFGLGPSQPPSINLQEFASPPGIGLVSSPPSFNPDQVSVTVSPPTSTTPYYTEVLIPKHASSELRGYSPDLRPRVSTTPRPQQFHKFTKFKEHQFANYGRDRNNSSIIFEPNSSAAYFSSVQDKSQMKLSQENHSELKPFREKFSHRKHLDEQPFTFTTAALTGAVVFRIPKPIKLSMSRAVKTRPLMVGMPKNYLHKRLGLTPQPSFYVPKQRDQKVKAWKSLGPLNWVPIGLGPPRRLGAAKLVPVTTKTDSIELEVLQSDDTKHELCKVDTSEDLYEDLKDLHREFIKKCFRRVKNCLLMDAVPLERRINYKEDQCINFCGHHPYCQSVAYSKTMSICDIFDKRNGTGPIRTVNYVGTTYYEALNSVALDCWRDGLSSLFYTRAPTPAVLVDSQDISGEAADEDTRRQETKSFASKEPVMIAPKDNCDADQDVLLMKSVGFRIRHLGVIPLPQNSSETECVFSCLVNLARGHIPYQCTAASYSSLSGCLIYKSGSNAKGNGHLIPANSFNHYEKACISRPMVELCKGYPIIRQPQRVLLGFTALTMKAESLVECLELCFFDFEKNGRCKSIMYFYEEREDNCVLNTESAISQPQFLAEENDSLVDYASFENCVEESKKEVRHSSLRSQQYRQPERRKKPPQMVRGPFEFGGIEDSKRVTVMTTTTATLPPPSAPQRLVHLSVGGTKEISSTRQRVFMDSKVKRHHRPLLRTLYTDETLFN